MHWPTIEEMQVFSPLPAGYRYERLKRSEIPTLIEGIKIWYPGIAVGSASRYLRSGFYENEVSLDGEEMKNVCVLLFKCGDEIAAMGSFEKDSDTLSIYSSLMIVAQSHRGAKLASCYAAAAEKMARAMGAELVWGIATFNHPRSQHLFEKAGWHLIGLTPGFDRELVENGVVKRVFEAVYVKVLVPDEAILRPDPDNMTPRTKALYDLLFPA